MCPEDGAQERGIILSVRPRLQVDSGGFESIPVFAEKAHVPHALSILVVVGFTRLPAPAALNLRSQGGTGEEIGKSSALLSGPVILMLVPPHEQGKEGLVQP